MKKLKNMLVAAIAIACLSTSAFAGSFGLGVSGSWANITGSGTETEGTETNSSNQTTASNTALIGSVFAEYSFDGDHGMTFGVDWLPGEADVNSKKLSRSDLELSQDGTGAHTAATVVRSAQATVENHLTYYAELPVSGGIYVKAGMVYMDVNTTETLNSGAQTYGNTDVDGTLIGLGYKHETGGNWYYKLEGTHVEFDTLTLNEQGQSAGSPTNKISADLDVSKATLALGYKF